MTNILFHVLDKKDKSSNYAITSLLIDNDVNIYAEDLLGNTPFDVAYSTKQFDVARLFLRKGYPIDKEDEGGYTPILKALLIGDPEIIDFLLREGASSHQKNLYQT